MMTAETLAAITDEEEEQLLLPEGWQVVRLESLCSIKGGKRLPAGTDFSPTKTAFPYIRVTDFTNGTIRTSQLKYLDEETQKQIARYIINRDDIYISIAGSIGIVGTIPAELDGANLTENAARLILDQEQVDRDFLARYLQSAEGQQQIKLRTNLVGQPKLALERIATIEIPLPPTIEEQKRISAVLDEQMNAVAQARAAVEAQLEAAQRLPNAMLRTVFDSEQAAEWENKKLGEICRDISDGTHFTPEYISSGVPFLSVKDIRENGIFFDNCRYISQDQHEDLCRRCKPERGDVLYTKVGTTGIAKAIETDKEFSIFVSVALLKLNEGISPIFLEKVLNSPIGKEQADNLTQGAANRNLVIRDIRIIEIPIPPTIEEQHKVAEMIDERMKEIEKLSKALTAQLAAINKMPAALLRKAFAGEI
jgi:type I restriction enzyme, S subunit